MENEDSFFITKFLHAKLFLTQLKSSSSALSQTFILSFNSK